MISPNQLPKLLIVDDDPNNLRILIGTLKQDYIIIAATNGVKARELAAKRPQPDLILLDVMMPEMDGYEVCTQLKGNDHTSHIPIIFFTALGESHDEAKGLQLGAADYIVKPINPAVLKARIKHHLTIRQLTEQLQSVNEQLESKVNQRTAELNHALEKIQQRTQELHRAVYLDSRTGLPSRASLMETLQSLCSREKGKHQPFALLVLNFIRFSLINNSLGHAVGDKVLQEIAKRFESVLHEGDTLYQIGGDEFCFLAHNLKTEQAIQAYAEVILQTLTSAIHVEGYEIFVHVRMGVVFGSQLHRTAVEILRDADTALHEAKASGAEGYYLFQPDLHDAAVKRLDLENALNRALKEEEFIVFYQPIIDLATGNLDGFEALVRWHRPEKGLIPPGKFIPCLEETGLIVPVGTWILYQAIQQLVTWQKSFGAISMSVNIAARQFTHPNFLESIDAALQKFSLQPNTLKFEVTESGLIETGGRTLEKILALRDRGLRISIDDFGTGYSSLSYLQKLPIDILKIDRCFVKDIGPHGENSAIAKAIVYMGDALGMDIIAEGCETADQVKFLQQLGCECGQGYFFAKPMPANVATEWMRDYHSQLY